MPQIWSLARLYAEGAKLLEHGRHVVLLVIRLYWGWQFFVTGRGKLQHIEDVAAWFGNDLGIPMPLLNAYAAATTEMVGGLLLLVGFASRPAAFALTVTMCVAYLTSDWQSLAAITSDPDKFVTAAPFLFLFAAVWVLVLGPGWLSVDGLVKFLTRDRVASQ